MASMNFTSTSIVNVSKANVPGFTSSFPHKFNRVCFTSASKHSQRKHAIEETNIGHNVDEAIKYAGDKSSEMGRDAKDGMKEGNERVEEGVTGMKDKANELAGKATDGAGDFIEMAKEKGQEIKKSLDEAASIAADKAGEDKKKFADMAKAAKDKTIDTVETVAEKTNETVAGALADIAVKGTVAEHGLDKPKGQTNVSN